MARSWQCVLLVSLALLALGASVARAQTGDNTDYPDEPQEAGFTEGGGPDYPADPTPQPATPADPYAEPDTDAPPTDEAIPATDATEEAAPEDAAAATADEVGEDLDSMPAGTVVGADVSNTEGSLPPMGQAGAIGEGDEKYDFTGTYNKMKTGNISAEGIIGIVVGSVLGTTLVLLCVCVCWIRQRNIYRAKHGYSGPEATGGQIEM